MTPTLYPHLLDQLKAENQSFEEFIHLLEHEASVLAGDYTHTQIHDIATQKTTWHQHYAQQQTQRQKLLQQLELQDSVEALQGLADQDPLFGAQLERLLAQAARARELNQANGALIHEYLAHHQQALNALEQLQPDSSGGTYDARGRRAQGGTGQRTQTQA